MLVSEMIGDDEAVRLITLIQKSIHEKSKQIPRTPSLSDQLRQVQHNKIGLLVKNYQESDLKNKLHVSDDDIVMARRAYLRQKEKVSQLEKSNQ